MAKRRDASRRRAGRNSNASQGYGKGTDPVDDPMHGTAQPIAEFISYEGVHPHPGMLEAWDRLVPGSAEKILNLSLEHADRTLAQRERALEVRARQIEVVESQGRLDAELGMDRQAYVERASRRGFILSFVGQVIYFLIVGGGLVTSVWLLVNGYDVAGLAGLITSLGGPSAASIAARVVEAWSDSMRPGSDEGPGRELAKSPDNS